MWFIGVEVEQDTSAPLLKKILDPPLRCSILLRFTAYLRFFLQFPILLQALAHITQAYRERNINLCKFYFNSFIV